VDMQIHGSHDIVWYFSEDGVRISDAF